MRTMPAAAVPEGAVVNVPNNQPSGPETFQMTIASIENSTPRPGLITWFDEDGHPVEIGGAIQVEVVAMPE